MLTYAACHNLLRYWFRRPVSNIQNSVPHFGFILDEFHRLVYWLPSPLKITATALLCTPMLTPEIIALLCTPISSSIQFECFICYSNIAFGLGPYLRFSNSLFSLFLPSLCIGAILPEIVKLTNLQQLNLAGNQLTGRYNIHNFTQ
jgi:hypothetical protein